jgi:hyperosmotically inducible protein
LSGSVGSIDAKRRAATVSWVNGTKDINLSDLKVNLWLKNDMLKTPRDVKSDQEIKEGIKDAFFYDPRVFSFNPTVNVKNKVARLTGNVSSLAAKIAAEQDAHNTVGVLSVINELNIEIPVKKTDEEIRSDVVKSLSFNLNDAQKEKIKVDVKNGEVMLTGSVTNPFIKNVAFNTASRVIGVKSVTIKLAFENIVMEQNDSKLEKQIENNIQWNPYLDLNADNINVKVKNGVARLTGNVKTWKEYFEASDEAAHAGVRQVENYMSINNKKFSSIYKTEALPMFYGQEYYVVPL